MWCLLCFKPVIALKLTLPTLFLKLTPGCLSLYICASFSLVWNKHLFMMLYFITSPSMSQTGGTLICYQHWVVAIIPSLKMQVCYVGWFHNHARYWNIFSITVHLIRNPLVTQGFPGQRASNAEPWSPFSLSKLSIFKIWKSCSWMKIVVF